MRCRLCRYMWVLMRCRLCRYTWGLMNMHNQLFSLKPTNISILPASHLSIVML